jgi:hypothetical protein
MSEQEKKSQFQSLAAGFLGFVGVVGLGSLVILHHGGGSAKPRIAYAPARAEVVSALTAPAQAAKVNLSGAPLGASANSLSSPAPTVPDEVREQASAAPAPAASGDVKISVASPVAKPDAKLVASGHLDGTASASSSAAASAAPSAKPKAKATALAKKPFLDPKLDLSKNQGAVASTVHSGVSNRAELMGRAAGPVYNFSGKSAGGQSGQLAADNAGPTGALQQVDVVQKQIDASDAIPADQKAKIHENLNQVRQTAGSAPAGQ